METKIQKLVDKNINLIVPWYLMLSYGYYCLEESFVSDFFYDFLSREFLENYDKIEHRHKHLITKEDLKAGTLYGLRENDYPLITRSAYIQVINE